jgi:ADP-ribose pyrophosphatase YjhB (NUDIX family)
MILQVGVKAFLRNKDGKYLLVKRNPDKYKSVKGDWDIVGGRINPGTSLIANLKREILEETSLKIISEPVLIVAQDIIPNSEKHVVRLTYTCECIGEPILDLSENIDYKWLSINEMKSLKDLDVYVKEIVCARCDLDRLIRGATSHTPSEVRPRA